MVKLLLPSVVFTAASFATVHAMHETLGTADSSTYPRNAGVITALDAASGITWTSMTDKVPFGTSCRESGKWVLLTNERSCVSLHLQPFPILIHYTISPLPPPYCTVPEQTPNASFTRPRASVTLLPKSVMQTVAVTLSALRAT